MPSLLHKEYANFITVFSNPQSKTYGLVHGKTKWYVRNYHRVIEQGLDIFTAYYKNHYLNLKDITFVNLFR